MSFTTAAPPLKIRNCYFFPFLNFTRVVFERRNKLEQTLLSWFEAYAEKSLNGKYFRGYAASCRVKRDEEEDNIKKEIDDLDHRVRREWIITESSRKKYEMLKNQLREYGYR